MLSRQTFLVLTLAIVSTALHAQDYRPFIPGKVHYYQSTPNYSVRIDSVGMVGADSTFWMNEIAVQPDPGCNPWFPNYHFLPHQEGFFADRFIHSADGAYRFVTRGGDTATFHTQVPTGTSWQFLSNSTLTATLSTRSLGTVGGAADSILTIDISDGKQYRLSRDHGLVAGPILGYYMAGRALQELAYDQVRGPIDFKDFIAIQPGDWFGTYEASYPFNRFIRWTATEREESVSGDTLRIRYQKQGATQENPSPWYPIGGSANLFYYRTEYGYLNMATYEVHMGPFYYNWVQPWNPSGLGGYFEIPSLSHYAGPEGDSCGYYPQIPQSAEPPFTRKTTQNLGDTYHNFSLNGGTTTTLLWGQYAVECYGFVNGDTLGPCPNAWLLTNADEAAPPTADFWTSYQPSSQRLLLGWEGMKPNDYALRVYDLQGRLLHAEALHMEAQGRADIAAPLANGIYLLQLQSPNDAQALAKRFVVLN